LDQADPGLDNSKPPVDRFSQEAGSNSLPGIEPQGVTDHDLHGSADWR